MITNSWEMNYLEANGQCKTASLLSQLIYLPGTVNALITTYLVSFVILEFLKCLGYFPAPQILVMPLDVQINPEDDTLKHILSYLYGN